MIGQCWYVNQNELTVGTRVRINPARPGIIKVPQNSIETFGVITRTSIREKLPSGISFGPVRDEMPVAHVQWLRYVSQGVLFTYNESEL